MAKILLVEDDPVLIDQVEQWLVKEQYTVEAVFDGQEALSRLKFYPYDLLVIDWGLPKISGLDVIKQLRSTGSSMPVLMLTGKGDIPDKQTGLDSGADDYLTKPFDLRELSARVRALLRRPAALSGSVLRATDLVLDTVTHKVTKGNAEIRLLPKEFSLLELFMMHPGAVFSADKLLEKIWSSESDSTVDTVYTFIKTLRKKISPDSPQTYIKTVQNVGYKFETPEG